MAKVNIVDRVKAMENEDMLSKKLYFAFVSLLMKKQNTAEAKSLDCKVQRHGRALPKPVD